MKNWKMLEQRKSCGGGGGGRSRGGKTEVAPPAGQLLLLRVAEILSAGAKMTMDAIAQVQQHRNKLHGAPRGWIPWVPVERGGRGKVEGGKLIGWRRGWEGNENCIRVKKGIPMRLDVNEI